jgi:hypothetical protein
MGTLLDFLPIVLLIVIFIGYNYELPSGLQPEERLFYYAVARLPPQRSLSDFFYGTADVGIMWSSDPKHPFANFYNA